MFNPTNSLVGRRFTASIGEPWDFVSSVGQNRLEGEIKAVAWSKQGQPRFNCTVSAFTVSGVVINQVIGVNRYVSAQDVIQVLEAGGNATMNFVFLKSGKTIAQDEIADSLSSEALSSFLVGSMMLS